VSITTRQGDDGTTSLLGGARVRKDHPRIEAVGAFDELGVELGGAKLASASAAARELLGGLQARLVLVMGEVADPTGGKGGFERIGPGDLALLDHEIGRLEAVLAPPTGWALAGVNPAALALERARVAGRRAERRLAALSSESPAPRPLLSQWSNRLSDLLWLMAREAEAGGRA